MESNNARKKRERAERAKAKKEERRAAAEKERSDALAAKNAKLKEQPLEEQQRVTALRADLKAARNSRKRARKEKISERLNRASAHFVVDLNFEALMTSKELRSIGTQVLTMYGDNCNSAFPFKLHLAGLIPESPTHQALQRAAKTESWVGFSTHSSQDLPTIFPDQQLFYLSPDATEVIQSIQPGAVYIVGGLVDRNRHPNASFNRAQQLNIPSVRLPIEEHAVVSRTDFLTISDVLKILSHFAECGDWSAVFGALSAVQRNGRRISGQGAGPEEQERAVAEDDEPVVHGIP